MQPLKIALHSNRHKKNNEKRERKKKNQKNSNNSHKYFFTFTFLYGKVYILLENIFGKMFNLFCYICITVFWRGRLLEIE